MSFLQIQLWVPTLILVALCVAGHLGRGRKSGEVLVKLAVFFVFLVFTSVSNAAFGLLSCRDDLGDGQSHLAGDLAVICHKGDHVGPRAMGITFAVLYPIGVPLGLLAALCWAWVKGMLYAKDNATGQFVVDRYGNRKPDERMSLVASMYERFKPEAC